LSFEETIHCSFQNGVALLLKREKYQNFHCIKISLCVLCCSVPLDL
ncbi:unnamed protein product, partial [Brassica rapa subsp. narinosa]